MRPGFRCGNTVSTAEHTLALLLALARNVAKANDSLKAGKWDRNKFTGTQLEGKTLGVVGLGRVGLAVAKRAQCFGMTVVGFDPFLASEKAQELSATLGKVVRINPDGSAPRDNPFVDRAGARPEIWSYGHRNVQAAALHPETGQLWTVEHGARGGDELNHPEAGKNYGWPVISYGTHYSFLKIGEGTAKEGMEQPVYYWDPVIAPSGMVFYTGDLFAGWKSNILVGSLTPGGLVRLVMKDGKVAQEERYLGDLRERIRDVRQASDGSLYLLTDAGNGKILRVIPATNR